MGILPSAGVIMNVLDRAFPRLPSRELAELVAAILVAVIREGGFLWPSHEIVFERRLLVFRAAAVHSSVSDDAGQLIHRPPLMIKIGGVTALVNETLSLAKGRVIMPG